MFQFSMRTVFVVVTLLMLLLGLPSLAMQFPPAVRTLVVGFAFLMALGGLAFLPLALLLVFCILATPDERNLKRGNVQSAMVFVFICLFALGPYISLTVGWLTGQFN